MCVGISWLASRGPLGGCFEASWEPFWGLMGPGKASRERLGRFLGSPGAFAGPLGGLSEASWGRLGSLGAEISIFQFAFPLLGPSSGLLGTILSSLGRLFDRLEAPLGRLGALFRPPGAVLEAFWELLGRSWSVGAPKKREGKKHWKNK